MTKFEQAFIQCLKDGVYPGPSNINERRGRGRFNRLNGRDTTRRLELMYDFGVPYQRGSAYQVVGYSGGEQTYYKVGEIPNPYKFQRNIIDDHSDVGWRKHEIMNPDEPWKLRRK